MDANSGSRKIVEVFIETDSESESYCSSEDRGETTETTLTGFEGEEEEDRQVVITEEEQVVEIDTTLKNEGDLLEPPTPTFSDPGFEQDSTFKLYHREGESTSPNNDGAEPDINFQEGMEVDLDIDHIGQSLGGSYPSQTETESLASSSHDSVVTGIQIATSVDSTAKDSQQFKLEEGMDEKMSESSTPEPKPIDPDKVYCFCRQPADAHSMIYCHECLEWFHGECVGITRQKAANIKHFYCPLCIDKNPSLVTVFESKSEKEAVGQERAVETGRERVGQSKGDSQHGKRTKSGKKHSRRCGECVACLTEVDCKKCRFCRDMTKYGGRGSLRQKCIKRQCLRYSRILYAEDPIYSKQNVFQQDIAAELRAVGGSVSDSSAEAFCSEEQSTKQSSIDKQNQLIHSVSMDTTGQSRVDQETDPSSNVDTANSKPIVSMPAKKKVGPSKKQKTVGRGGGVKGGGVSKGKSGGQKGRTTKAKTKTRLSASDLDYEGVQLTSSGRRSRQPFSDIFLGGGHFRDEVHTPQQCYGPECVFAARPHSKYCSEDCGVQLALKRIHKYLPEKKTLCGSVELKATLKNRENLQKLDEDQKAIKTRLEELDKQTLAIDNHVQRISAVTPINEDEKAEADSDDLTIHCATCSQPVTLKKAMVHFEKCFNRLEGMVSFGSIVKNEGTNIFCDKFDSSQKTYCKRLRVLCPEHNREPKIGPNEVCGCPLESKFPSELLRSKHYCRLPKKSCGMHYCWEKLRKAEIDQEKLNMYLKLEELSEHSRLNQWQIDCRNSLLAIMLHHTIDHDKESSKKKDSLKVTDGDVSCLGNLKGSNDSEHDSKDAHTTMDVDN